MEHRLSFSSHLINTVCTTAIYGAGVCGLYNPKMHSTVMSHNALGRDVSHNALGRDVKPHLPAGLSEMLLGLNPELQLQGVGWDESVVSQRARTLNIFNWFVME